MSDDVKKQVEGACTEISEKNGWTTFNIDVGRQYPVRLSTKIEALITAARAAGNQRAVWTYSESQGGENPNRPGTHYVNRRLEKVEVGGTLDPTLAPSTGATSSSAMGGRSDAERISIERQTLVKAAVELFPGDAIKTVEEWFNFLRKVDGFLAEPRAAAPAAAASPPPAQTSTDMPPPDDDDIPF